MVGDSLASSHGVGEAATITSTVITSIIVTDGFMFRSGTSSRLTANKSGFQPSPPTRLQHKRGWFGTTSATHEQHRPGLPGLATPAWKARTLSLRATRPSPRLETGLRFSKRNQVSRTMNAFLSTVCRTNWRTSATSRSGQMRLLERTVLPLQDRHILVWGAGRCPD